MAGGEVDVYVVCGAGGWGWVVTGALTSTIDRRRFGLLSSFAIVFLRAVGPAKHLTLCKETFKIDFNPFNLNLTFLKPHAISPTKTG